MVSFGRTVISLTVTQNDSGGVAEVKLSLYGREFRDGSVMEGKQTLRKKHPFFPLHASPPLFVFPPPHRTWHSVPLVHSVLLVCWSRLEVAASAAAVTFPQRSPLQPSPSKKPCPCQLCSIQRCVQFYKLHCFLVPWERWCREGEKLGGLALWFLSQAPRSAWEMVQSWREAGWVNVVVSAMLCHPSRGSWVGHGFPWALSHSLDSPEAAEMVLRPGGGS